MANPDKSAFPLTTDYMDGDGGLTKREWFAGLAMAGILANTVVSKEVIALGEKEGARVLVNAILGMADGVLAELEKA